MGLGLDPFKLLPLASFFFWVSASMWKSTSPNSYMPQTGYLGKLFPRIELCRDSLTPIKHADSLLVGKEGSSIDCSLLTCTVFGRCTDLTALFMSGRNLGTVTFSTSSGMFFFWPPTKTLLGSFFYFFDIFFIASVINYPNWQ